LGDFKGVDMKEKNKEIVKAVVSNGIKNKDGVDLNKWRNCQPSKRATKIENDLRTVQTRRVLHDTAVKECLHFVLPRKSDTREIHTIAGFNGGELKAYANLFTRSARSSNQKMASGIFNYLTPKNQKWFKITTGDKEKDSVASVYEWFDGVRDTILDFISRSNFAEMAHETYLNLGVVGTVCSQIEWDEERQGINFIDHPYSTFWFTEDNRGRPLRVYREFLFTAEQAKLEWGLENICHCKQIMKALQSKEESQRGTQFKFIHLVEPNPDYDKNKIAPIYKKYKSIYIAEEDKQIIHEGGFDEIPYIIARFLKYNTEGNVMGYSPAMDCMPIIKTFENLKKKFLLAIEKNVNPAMARGVSMGLVPNKVKTTPNSVNNFDSRNPDSKPTPILQQIDLSYTLQELESETKQIEDAFFIPSFQTITNIDKSNATATEILARQQEALATISPSISRIEDEWLEPIISKVFKILYDQGLISPPPSSLGQESVLKIEFTGVLSSSPKLAESYSIRSYFEELGIVLNFAPDEERMKMFMSLNFYEINKTLQQNRNLPVSFIKTKEEIEEEMNKIREQQQAQENQQQMVDLAKSQDLGELQQKGMI
jgi:hypothetical protein